ncbi:hypothetical protein ABZY05_23990, partial [Streptomyces canus]|uniref:hypothetical protein n=1 Tax=Streptomyces canus TaxID=58343 RepID=UPI0033B76D35
MRFVSDIEGHSAFSMAHRRLVPAPGDRFFSAPRRRLPALGSWRSRTVLGADRTLLGPYRSGSRSTPHPARSRASLDPSRSP